MRHSAAWSVKSVEKEEGGGEMRIPSGSERIRAMQASSSSDSARKSLGAQIGDGTHRFVHPVHQSLQRLIWTLPDRKQSVIGIETRTRTLCKVHRLEFCPDSNGVRLNSPKMDPLLMLHSKKERTSSLLLSASNPATLPPQLHLLFSSPENQHPKTPHHQPCLHLHGH